jgi:hypothetical protein
MPLPPAGNQYEVWLVGANGAERQSLGILRLDENGRGKLTYDDSRDRNLLAFYNQVEVTIEPGEEADGEIFRRVAYSYTLPATGLEYIRSLLVSFSLAPEQVALIQGLSDSARLIDQAAREMSNASENGDQAAIQEHAEAIFNLLAGSQHAEYKDWNEDGEVADPGDGYGFLRYVQAVYAYADYAANSPGASQNMIVNGANVKTCAQNLAQWAPQLRDRILTILNDASSTEVEQLILDAVTLADQVLKGSDQDTNGTMEAIFGECGVITTYEYAYYLADMPLLPINPLDTPTTTGTASVTTGTTPIFGQPTNTSARPPNGTNAPNTSLPATNPPSNPTNTPSNPTDPPSNPTDPPSSPTDPPSNPTDPPNPPPTRRPPTKTPKPPESPENPFNEPQPQTPEETKTPKK